ncbi:ribonuclease T2-like protein [Armillaria mellea]|nr:ribonuclease T2-like protein [Armillaria mellea]
MASLSPIPTECLILAVEFWDFNPSTGPSDSWTIHGLWPDHCDSTFDQSCDPSRAYTGIASLLTNNGASDTLSFMQTHWVDINGDNEGFWEHEWSKHGTCMSTLELDCFSGITKGQEAVAYFQTVVALYKTLPTYDWLANQGITPSSTATYSLSKVLAALKTESGGFTPALDCDGGSLNQIYWYFHLRGSVVDGDFVPISAPSAGTCGSTVKYPPKSGSSTPTSTVSGHSGRRTFIDHAFRPLHPPPLGTSGGTLPAKATIVALQSGSQIGGLLSLGTWSTQTLATFTTTGNANSFTMTSSKGNCGVSSGVFACGSGVSLSTFSTVLSNGELLLSFNGATNFSSDGSPSGSTVFTVFAVTGYAGPLLQLLQEFVNQNSDQALGVTLTMPPPSDHPSLHLTVLPNDFFVVQLKHNEIDNNVLINLTSQPPERFFSLTRTVEEVSVVGEIHKNLSKIYHNNSGWRCIRIAGPMEFSKPIVVPWVVMFTFALQDLTGILASFTLPLREAQVPVFAVSTWNTDYVLVPKDKLEVAVGALKKDGWTFIS